MGLVKHKVEQPSPEQQAAELLRDIHALRARLDQYLDSRALEIKNTRDGSGLPINSIRAGLMGVDHCFCHVVARLLGEPGA
jgi:hypothetical protein